MLERVTNLVDLVFLLKEKHLILLAQYDWHPFPLSMKLVLLGFWCFLPSWVIFVICFGKFEHLQSQDLVISVEKGYKFSLFTPSARGQTLDIATTAWLSAIPTQSEK